MIKEMTQYNQNNEDLDRIEKERIQKEKLESKNYERLHLEKQITENKLYPNNMLFVIPSWGALLGHPTLGTYANHKVQKIDTDIVMFLSAYDYSIQTSKGTLHYLFGLGFHFLKFEIESGIYITDHRTLTGLVLSDFVYDQMASSKNITLENDRDIVIAEKVVRIPVDLSYKSENQITFIKGALMRNVFIPNKDAFLNFIEHIKDPSTYQISSHGHMILSTQVDLYDKILVSEKMRTNPYKNYLDSAAGLSGIVFSADQLLQDTILSDNLQIIESTIEYQKNIYANLEFDPMYIYSLLENASNTLKSDGPQIPTSPGTTPKQSIFASAATRMDAYINWPIKFMRKEKKVVPSTTNFIDPTGYVEPIPIKKPSIINTSRPDYKQEHFEIRTQKSDRVDFKPLPNPPSNDFQQIIDYIKRIIEENYEMRSIGKGFEIARDSMRQLGISTSSNQQKIIWEMSKQANIYLKKGPNMGLPQREKRDLLIKLDKWVSGIDEDTQKMKKQLDRERLVREKRDRGRKEREERERIDKEKRMIREKTRELERLEKINSQKAKVKSKQSLGNKPLPDSENQERLKSERAIMQQFQTNGKTFEIEKQGSFIDESDRMKEARDEVQALAREKRELDKIMQERKKKEKLAKQQIKQQKKIQKQRQKVAKKKQKEQERLKKLG